MPILNPNKCYTQQPKRVAITVPENLSSHWRTDFYALLNAQLKLNDDRTQAQESFDHQTNTWVLLTEKELFFKALERHLGPQSIYALKPQLLDSFCQLYVLFTHPKTSEDKRYLIASRIKDNVGECTPGFHNQVSYLISLFNMPQNGDELLAQVRFNLVDRIARSIAEQNTQGIHVHNRVINVAQNAGFGVWPINPDDVYSHAGSQNLSDEDIIRLIQKGFANHFQLFAVVNALRDELEALIVPHGYQGQRAMEHHYKQGEVERFCECIKRFIPNQESDLLERDIASGCVTDINWRVVTRQLLHQLRDEHYVTLTQEEAALLDKLLLGDMSSLDLALLNTLIPHGYELVQCLVLFREWSVAQKAAWVRAYLKNKSPDEQKEVLTVLHNEAPQLTTQLKKEANLQALYFAIAIAEKEVAGVRAYIEQGADINDALVLLFSPAHKRDTLYWLHDNPLLVQKLTVPGMNKVIAQGKYQGKTIAETLMSTKKGRQLVLENGPLQTLLAGTSIAHQLSMSLKQADTEKQTVGTQEGFFKKPSPLATELVQSIVYGDLKKAEALELINPAFLKTLLAEKVTVIDYSRRKVKQKTAFQAALCAIDDELCTMLAQYMSKEELARQYQELFPNGHDAHYQAQTPFDFSSIVQAINQSSDADVEKALSLELPNDTPLWGKLAQFRTAFTNRSSQDIVFNPKHLIKAFELYDSQYNHWNQNQRDLFWRQVVGYVQRFLPANIAMDFAQGLYNRVEMKEKSRRRFKFTIGDGSIFPLSFDSFSGLGYEYAGWAAGCGCASHVGIARDAGLFAVPWFSKLMSSKNSSFWENYTARGCLQLLSNSVR